MARIELNKHFAASPERVFAAITNFPNAAEVVSAITRMEMLTDGPVGLGTRFKETRVVFRKQASEVMEVTSWDPPGGFVLDAQSHGSHYRTEYTLTPAGEGTDLRMIFEVQPLTTVAKLMSFLMRPLLKSCLKMMEKDLNEIEASILGSPAART